MKEKCPICGDEYTNSDKKIEYHFQYKPEITTDACTGCNMTELIIRHPEKKKELDPDNKYYLSHRIEKVKRWTLKNRPLIMTRL